MHWSFKNHKKRSLATKLNIIKFFTNFGDIWGIDQETFCSKFTLYSLYKLSEHNGTSIVWKMLCKSILTLLSSCEIFPQMHQT